MIARRALLGVGSAALVSCARGEEEYFGTTVAPGSSTLVHTLGGEPETLDPALSTGSWEFYVIPALFEGLTQYHPDLPVPMAALATHYYANADFTQFTFYLRGHPAPHGTRFPDTSDLPARISDGRKSEPASKPALWSDGRLVTAHDFVYSWRRFLIPATAAPMAYQFFYIRKAEEIHAGKRDFRDLGSQGSRRVHNRG